MYEALMWLKSHNEIYKDIAISDEHLASLPEDDVQIEILSIIRNETNVDVIQKESAGYVPHDEINEDDKDAIQVDENEIKGNCIPDADVIPLQYLGVTDMEMNSLSLNELMQYALANTEDKSKLKEGGYAV
ncbi:hypothetical protein DFH29DRAFT_883381 [Suillus ampliporus]|nr:hypothetical protein DFH29DRAFT_883381 [Suillus ampliporus]